MRSPELKFNGLKCANIFIATLFTFSKCVKFQHLEAIKESTVHDFLLPPPPSSTRIEACDSCYFKESKKVGATPLAFT